MCYVICQFSCLLFLSLVSLSMYQFIASHTFTRMCLPGIFDFSLLKKKKMLTLSKLLLCGKLLMLSGLANAFRSCCSEVTWSENKRKIYK